MKHPVRLERRHGLAVIVVDNPPVNALGHAVRLGILAALEAAQQDDRVTSIILSAQGRTFPAGADIKEFDMPARAPSLADLCDILEASSKPVIAALHGMVFGGGLELAMAAHYRIATPDTQFALPEIKLGLLPGAGGTQRAPRLMPVADALGMMLHGHAIKAKRAEQIGLIDGIAEDDLRETVMLLAPELDQPRATRYLRHHLGDGMGFMAVTAEARAGLAEDNLAGARIIECVEAALLVPFDAALEMERQAFADCMASDTSVGLRYAFFAERRAQKFPELEGITAQAAETVSIIGDGAVAIQLALSCLIGGLSVTLVASGEAGVTKALDVIGAYYSREAQAGRITQAQGAGALSKLTLTSDTGAIAQSDVVVESVRGPRQASETVLRRMGQIAKPEAVLCTNRSDYDMATLAAVTNRPAHSMPLNFFMPLNGLRVVELGVAESIDPQAIARSFHLVKTLGLRPVRASARAGLICARMLSAYLDAADAFLLKGASPNQVDAAMRAYGMAEGPYEMQDRASLTEVQAVRVPKEKPVLLLPARMVQAGCIGRAAGQGYYLYDSDGRARPNEELMRLLVAERRERGISVTPSTAVQIQTGLVGAMINQGAALLEDETACSVSDIDAGILYGLGFPREKGGPMHQANQIGVFQILTQLEQLQKVGPSFCKITPLLRKKAAERQVFGS